MSVNFQYIPRTNEPSEHERTWREFVEPIPACPACGYVESDIPTSADNAHDSLCCGGREICFWAGDPKETCVTHWSDVAM